MPKPRPDHCRPWRRRWSPDYARPDDSPPADTHDWQDEKRRADESLEKVRRDRALVPPGRKR